MWKKASALGGVLVLAVVVPASAQRVEVGVHGGYVFSDGVDGDAVLASDGNIYDEIDVADSASWGASVGVLLGEQMEVGFLFNQQMSRMDVKGTSTVEVGDLTVTSYHPYFAFNFGAADAKARPYVLFGFGATHYGNVDFVALGASRQISSETQFSSTLGAGLKYYPAPHVGVKFGVQWTPTYIKSDNAGWWCDPWYGCYLVGDPQYSNQFQLSGGVTFRF